MNETKENTEMSTNPNNNPYGGIGDASGEGRFPFFSEKGRYVVVITGWHSRVTRAHGPADFTDFKVLKVLSGGEGVDPGTHRTRMRTFKGDSAGPALEEVKQRALVAYAAAGLPMKPADITGEVMVKITENDGGLLKGHPFVMDIGDKVKTKSGKEFSPANYFVATARELEGVDVG